MTKRSRDVLSPREVAERAGFSYHAILRAIRRGDLVAYEPIPGQYRIDLDEYERWLRQPTRRSAAPPPQPVPRPRRSAVNRDPAAPGSFARLRSIAS
jgi:excisionase family DNA binding protein